MPNPPVLCLAPDICRGRNKPAAVFCCKIVRFRQNLLTEGGVNSAELFSPPTNVGGEGRRGANSRIHHSGASRNLIARKGDPLRPTPCAEMCALRRRDSGFRRNGVIYAFFGRSGGKFGDVAEILHREGILRYNRSESGKCVLRGRGCVFAEAALFFTTRGKTNEKFDFNYSRRLCGVLRALCGAFSRACLES